MRLKQESDKFIRLDNFLYIIKLIQFIIDYFNTIMISRYNFFNDNLIILSVTTNRLFILSR